MPSRIRALSSGCFGPSRLSFAASFAFALFFFVSATFFFTTTPRSPSRKLFPNDLDILEKLVWERATRPRPHFPRKNTKGALFQRASGKYCLFLYFIKPLYHIA